MSQETCRKTVPLFPGWEIMCTTAKTLYLCISWPFPEVEKAFLFFTVSFQDICRQFTGGQFPPLPDRLGGGGLRGNRAGIRGSRAAVCVQFPPASFAAEAARRGMGCRGSAGISGSSFR